MSLKPFILVVILCASIRRSKSCSSCGCGYSGGDDGNTMDALDTEVIRLPKLDQGDEEPVSGSFNLPPGFHALLDQQLEQQRQLQQPQQQLQQQQAYGSWAVRPMELPKPYAQAPAISALTPTVGSGVYAPYQMAVPGYQYQPGVLIQQESPCLKKLKKFQKFLDLKERLATRLKAPRCELCKRPYLGQQACPCAACGR